MQSTNPIIKLAEQHYEQIQAAKSSQQIFVEILISHFKIKDVTDWKTLKACACSPEDFEEVKATIGQGLPVVAYDFMSKGEVSWLIDTSNLHNIPAPLFEFNIEKSTPHIVNISFGTSIIDQ